jgi:hypothetical protein
LLAGLFVIKIPLSLSRTKFMGHYTSPTKMQQEIVAVKQLINFPTDKKRSQHNEKILAGRGN